MSKQGMKRPEISNKGKNSVLHVQEIQGEAKHGHNKATPIIAGTNSPEQKIYHSKLHSHSSLAKGDRPISEFYPEIDTDLARDNIENDITAADLQDL